ncbi:phage baseplate assembly protein V [Neisseria meningitidis]|uniref:Phage baseplate assembly protein V n=1 Tax=Neisseria meningitidis serogroup B (strain ATCC 13091 / M2091) TaxID=862513 RepID=E0N7G4_NEIM3|nr:phage baseplate assembly protein V [Neisseria meningitidis]EFM05079.1 phage baseplate assembly protein V [Neisseria meningitidis ATCC 13091]
MDAKTIDNRIRRAFNGIRQAFRGKIARVKAPGGVNIDAPNVGCTAQITAEGQINGNGGMAVKGGSGTSFTGNVQMVGDLDTTGKLTNNGKNVGSDHKHNGDSGGTTSDPL